MNDDRSKRPLPLRIGEKIQALMRRRETAITYAGRVHARGADERGRSQQS
ncbi:MAG TPA: hypothetical protein VKM55_01055 [Candidatus Lokiarchaeia archaeon]|nr:hypothetical protein [Candidatus Lokiarchaeia archaeon]